MAEHLELYANIALTLVFWGLIGLALWARGGE